MKKTILIATLCLCLLFSLTGCGKTALEEATENSANLSKEEVADKVVEGFYKVCKADSSPDEYADGLLEIISLETKEKQKYFSNSNAGLNEMISRDKQIYQRNPNDRYAASLNGNTYLIATSDNNYKTTLDTLSLSDDELTTINSDKEAWLISEDDTVSGIAEISISFLDSRGELIEIPVGARLICVNGTWKLFYIALAK